MQIIEISEKQNNIHIFYELLEKLYDKEQIYQKKMCENITNAFLVNRYVLLKNEKPKAHIAIYYNENLQFDEKIDTKKPQKIFCIGNYEAFDDIEVAKKILEFALKEIKKMQGTYILAQMQGTTWENYRFSVHNHSPNFFLEPYHQAYYHTHFLEMGFEIVEKYFSSIDQYMVFDTPLVLLQEKKFVEMGVTFSTLDLENYEENLRKIFAFNALAFSQNVLYSPISEDFFVEKYLKILPIIQKDYVIIAKDTSNEIIGVFFAIPDIWDKSKKTLIIKSISRHPSPQWQGLGHVIGNILYRNASKNGITHIIHAFMRENGFSTQISKNYSGEIYKKYVLLGYKISL